MSTDGQRRKEARKARMGIASVAPAMKNRFTTSSSAAMAALKIQKTDGKGPCLINTEEMVYSVSCIFQKATDLLFMKILALFPLSHESTWKNCFGPTAVLGLKRL